MCLHKAAVLVEEATGEALSSPGLISAVTEAVTDDAAGVVAWQMRPLEATDVVVCFDALRVKISDEDLVRSAAVHLAIGGNCVGAKEAIGLRFEQTEGAGFWTRVMTESCSHGTTDVLNGGRAG